MGEKFGGEHFQGKNDMINRPPNWSRYLKGFPWLTLGIVLVLRIGVAEANFVPTGSMQPTIGVVDVLVVDKTAYGLKLPFTQTQLLHWDNPKRGDIITFDPAHTDDVLIKRVIGLPGDVIATRQGFLFVNGEQVGTRQPNGLIREQLAGLSYLTTPARPQNFGPVRVPDGQLFVMGDNRANSADSRFWGFLPMERVRGKAVTRLFSTEWLRHPRDIARFGSLYR